MFLKKQLNFRKPWVALRVRIDLVRRVSDGSLSFQYDLFALMLMQQFYPGKSSVLARRLRPLARAVDLDRRR